MMVALAGCRADNTTAAGTVSVAYSAVNAGNLAKLRLVLAGEALERFGNAEGLTQLRNEYTGYTLLSNRSTLVSQLNYRDGRAAQRTYTVEVRGKKESEVQERVISADVVCAITYEARPIPRDGMIDIERTVSRCKITGVAL